MVFLVSLDTQGPVHGFCGMWGVLAAALFDWGKAGRQKILWADVIFQFSSCET